MTAADTFSFADLKAYEGVEAATDPRGAPITENLEPVEASEIRAFCYAIGDYNPLYTDPAYAARSRFGGVVAPPQFYYAIDRVAPPCPRDVEPGLDSFGIPGARHVYGGNDWTFHAPIRAGDVVRVRRKFLRVEEKAGEFAGNSGIAYGETSFTNQRDELLAVAICHLFVAPLRAASDRGKYRAESAFPTYSEEDRARIAAEKAKGLRLRGSEPRYFEDTNEGDVITPTVQGPLWDAEIARFSVGWRTGPLDTVRGFPRRLRMRFEASIRIPGPAVTRTPIRTTGRGRTGPSPWLRQRDAADVLAVASGDELDGRRCRSQAPRCEAGTPVHVGGLQLLHRRRDREANRERRAPDRL